MQVSKVLNRHRKKQLSKGIVYCDREMKRKENYTFAACFEAPTLSNNRYHGYTFSETEAALAKYEFENQY